MPADCMVSLPTATPYRGVAVAVTGHRAAMAERGSDMAVTVTDVTASSEDDRPTAGMEPTPFPPALACLPDGTMRARRGACIRPVGALPGTPEPVADGLSTNRSFPTVPPDASIQPESASTIHVGYQRRITGRLIDSDAMTTNTTGQTFAYARVSTDAQELALQLDAFTAAGIAEDHVFTDHASGAKASRPELDALLRPGFLREGDTLVVWRLDRLGRNLGHLIAVVEDLGKRGVAFRSLSETIDTSTPAGELIFHIFGAFAQFERRLIQERVNAGLVAARARGKVGGRKPKLTPDQAALAQRLYDAREHTVQQIADMFSVPRSTVYGHLDRKTKDEDDRQPQPA